MLNSALQSVANDWKIIGASTLRVVVKFSKGKSIEELAKELGAEFRRMAPYAGYTDVEQLEDRELESYLSTLLWMRVCRVVNANDRTFSEYKSLSYNVAVPVIYQQVLIGVGRAYDSDFNLEFWPAYNPSQDDILSPEDMYRIDRLFRQFESAGMKICLGIPRQTEGELDFMAMSHVADIITSYRKVHPVYGFLASFVAQQELSEITGKMSRVIYGYDSDYKARLGAVIRAINQAN